MQVPAGPQDSLRSSGQRHGRHCRSHRGAEPPRGARRLASDLWTEKGYVFTSPAGEPLNPNTDHHEWKDLLKAAGLRAGRLHDARHTAATVLLILGVPDTVVDALKGWEPGKSARMRRRYQHLTNRVLTDTADKIGGLLWPLPEVPPVV